MVWGESLKSFRRVLSRNLPLNDYKTAFFVTLFTFIILFGEGGSCQYDAGKVIAEPNKTCSQDLSKCAMKREM